MAIYHLSMKAISRKAGRSTTAAAAYRAGVELVDQRTGVVHDYSRKRGVAHSQLVLPGGQVVDRGDFWNAVELHHKRGDAVVGREVVVALPDELPPAERQRLAVELAERIAKLYGVAVDLAIHEPSAKGDDRNWHAHLLLSACHVNVDGTLGKKCVALDPVAAQRPAADGTKRPNAATDLRPVWEGMVNAALERGGMASRVDHRSHATRGIVEPPSEHDGPTVTAIKRRRGRSTVQQRRDAERVARLAASQAAEREVAQSAREVAAIRGELVAAEAVAADRAAREAQQKPRGFLDRIEKQQRDQAAQQPTQQPAEAPTAPEQPEAQQAAQQAAKTPRKPPNRGRGGPSM